MFITAEIISFVSLLALIVFSLASAWSNSKHKSAGTSEEFGALKSQLKEIQEDFSSFRKDLKSVEKEQIECGKQLARLDERVARMTKER